MRAVGVTLMLLSGAFALGAAANWLAAITTKPSNLSYLDPQFWFKLTPEGDRFTKRGFFCFFIALGLGGAGWLLLNVV